jgi:HlyD family secretion protein
LCAACALVRRPDLWGWMDIAKETVSRAGNGMRIVTLGMLVCGGIALSLSLQRLRAASPTVERSALWIDTVRRGDLVREVSGPGTLVPNEIRWISAQQSARIESIQVEPGAPVEAGTVLLELSNPDFARKALEAEANLRSAEADLASLKAQLPMEVLAQDAKVAEIKSEWREAQRQVTAGEELARKDLIATFELRRRQDKAEELDERLELERNRTEILRASSEERVRSTTEKVARLRALWEYSRKEVADLRMVAGMQGVLQELRLEVGQQVSAGMVLAKVARLDRLKAEAKIPESQAREVGIGQRASVDLRGSTVRGRVVRIDPAVQQGTVTVDIAIDDALPAGARAEQSIDARIELETRKSVLLIGRPANVRPSSTGQLFALDRNGRSAIRHTLRFGGSSVSLIEVLDGAAEGDRLILSDTSQWDAVDSLKIQ